MDRLSREHRSWNMSRIRGRNTAPERAVRSLLHRLGYRFRLHSRKLPGRPDVVLPKYSSVVLVHGCFWHRHSGCQLAYTPKSRIRFWSRKFAGNVARDLRNAEALHRAGWRVIVVWECELRNTITLARRLDRTLRRTRAARTG
jgi:DNA mismatch endonuclease (patch repair protein)